MIFRDGSRAAQHEETILITKDGYEVLTKHPDNLFDSWEFCVFSYFFVVITHRLRLFLWTQSAFLRSWRQTYLFSPLLCEWDPLFVFVCACVCCFDRSMVCDFDTTFYHTSTETSYSRYSSLATGPSPVSDVCRGVTKRVLAFLALILCDSTWYTLLSSVQSLLTYQKSAIPWRSIDAYLYILVCVFIDILILWVLYVCALFFFATMEIIIIGYMAPFGCVRYMVRSVTVMWRLRTGCLWGECYGDNEMTCQDFECHTAARV